MSAECKLAALDVGLRTGKGWKGASCLLAKMTSRSRLWLPGARGRREGRDCFLDKRFYHLGDDVFCKWIEMVATQH